MILPFLRAIRPHQWVKNLFVAAPVLFGQRLTDPTAVVHAAAAVALFCLISSAIYLFNDLIDVEQDRLHPRKCHRPIAAGELSEAAARLGAGLLAAAGLALGLGLGLGFFAAAAGYFALNITYSLALKRIAYLDVLAIAAGFLLRVAAGAYAVQVPASPWLFLCTGFLACFLGFGKRTHELSAFGARGVAQREVLASYSAALLRGALFVSGGATFMAYLAYTTAPHTRNFFRTDRMLWTAPLIALGLVRFGHLVARSTAESPTEEMLRDPLFLANLAAWVVAVVVFIYVAPGTFPALAQP